MSAFHKVMGGITSEYRSNLVYAHSASYSTLMFGRSRLDSISRRLLTSLALTPRLTSDNYVARKAT